MTARRSALIVATSEYKDRRLAPLDGPGRDAEALRGVLAQKDIGAFDVRVALNSRVDNLRRTLEAFFADRARDDLLLVHFSGHGLKDDDGQLYLAAADTEIDRLLSTGVDAAWVNRLMNKCRSEKIALFLDCCFAGAFTTAMARRVGVDTAGVKDHFNGSGLFVITASDAMQYSFEGGTQVGLPPEPSPFTKALVDGLQSGEADRNEDGEVSINELFDFLEDRIRETSPSQTPTKSAFNQVGDWVIAHSTRAPTVRLLPEGLQQQLKSEDALDRFGALIDLRDLIEGPDRRVSEAALQALGRLAADDSRRVAASAQRLLEEEAAKPRSARSGRRRGIAVPAPVEPSAVGPDATAEPEAAAVAEPEATAVEPEAAAAAFEAAGPDVVQAPPAIELAAAATAPAEPATIVAATLGAMAAPVEPAIIERPEPAAIAPMEPAVAAPPGPEMVTPTAPPFVAPMTPPPAAWAPLPGPQPAAVAPAMAHGHVAGWSSPTASDGASRSIAAAGPSEVHVRAPSSEIPWSLGRAASRAAIGSFLWTVLQFAWFLANNPDVQNDPQLLDVATNAFSVLIWLIAIATTVVVAFAEYLVPAVRLPGGRLYQSFGGDRWVGAAILGIVTGLTIGLGIEFVYLTNQFHSMLGLGWEIPVCAAIGFLVAELAVGRRFRRKREERSQSA